MQKEKSILKLLRIEEQKESKMGTCPVCGKMLEDHSAEEYARCRDDYEKSNPRPQVIPVPKDEE
ncbi:MAG: hypothetical protein HYT12_01080 [Candidatus Liptonbacteria bacterium]|nr:hypothetical protein [Candidatus Liptonbacteria bacterium]